MLKETLLSQILDGALNNYKKHLSGIYKDYYICIDFKEPFYFVRINATSTDGKAITLNTFLTEKKKELRHLKSVEITDFEILLAIVQPNFKRNVPQVLNTVIEPVMNFLSANGFTSGCGKCGNDTSVYCVEIKKQHHHYCETCSSEAEIQNKTKKKW